jgi:hypothetical protein
MIKVNLIQALSLSFNSKNSPDLNDPIHKKYGLQPLHIGREAGNG